MQTIETKYLSPTNTRGARIKATASGGMSATIPYPYSGTLESMHWEAAQALRDRLGWTGEMIGGSTQDGMVFVFANDDRYGS